MAYQGSAAYRLDNREAWEVPARRPLSVHEGGGLDARNRADSSRPFSQVARLVIAVTIMFVLLGSARVALTAQTVTLLGDLAVAEQNVADARDTRSELQIERSVLSSTDRIQRIATENYGMVYATDVDSITIDPTQDGQASADDAQVEEDASATRPMA